MDTMKFLDSVAVTGRTTFAASYNETLSVVTVTDDVDYTNEIIITRVTPAYLADTQQWSYPYSVWTRDAHGVTLDCIADTFETAEARATFLSERELSEIEEDTLRPIKEEMEALAQERYEREWNPYGDDDL